MRDAKAILLATKRFAHEQVWRSWWHVGTTLLIHAALVCVVCLELPLAVRVLASIVSGLVVVRLFVIYHDYQHGAILRRSPVARGIMFIFGMLALTPPSVWNRSHDHHHKNNCKSFGINVGSYPLMTTRAFARASRWERFWYAASRHGLTIALGYLTTFLYGMCVRLLAANPRRHFDAALSIVSHFGLIALLVLVGWDYALLLVVVPFMIAAGTGSYLFYAQHNFPKVRLRFRSEWSYVDAALESSSFMQMSPLMHWFTANIGYHHVHHLNSRIPFYRLPEAMAAIEELQSPNTTSLNPLEIARCLRLKLWDAEKKRLVAFDGT